MIGWNGFRSGPGAFNPGASNGGDGRVPSMSKQANGGAPAAPGPAEETK